jgi:uncharacterized membrane protein
VTSANARVAANLVMGAAGVAAAYVVLTTPPLRRLAFRAARVWIGAVLPMYLMNQIRDAWEQSGQRLAAGQRLM